MINGINSREMILEILLEIEEGEHSHVAIRNALSKYQFLPKQDRAFITRVCEGTLEYRIQIDYIINSFSKVTVDKMKPAIREILRSAVYQLKYSGCATSTYNSMNFVYKKYYIRILCQFVQYSFNTFFKLSAIFSSRNNRGHIQRYNPFIE